MKNFVVMSNSHIVEDADTREQANAAQAKWFRNFPNTNFRVVPSSLYAILNMTVYGNAHHDTPIFEAIHAFIVDKDNTREDKKTALRYLNDTVMGLDRMEDEDKELDSYLEQAALDIVTGQE